MAQQPSTSSNEQLPLDFADDNTLDKMAGIEALLNKMEQTPTAADVLVKRILNLVNKEDLQKMVELQTHMLVHVLYTCTRTFN